MFSVKSFKIDNDIYEFDEAVDLETFNILFDDYMEFTIDEWYFIADNIGYYETKDGIKFYNNYNSMDSETREEYEPKNDTEVRLIKELEELYEENNE